MAQDGRRVNGYDYSANASTEYQRFKTEYFTGADIRIYFGDIWVDEITSLQFTLQEQVVPIFGYASYTWDKVARGNRYIQGAFSINFKESYYLHSVINRLSSKMKEAADSPTAPFSIEKWKEGVDIEHLLQSEGNNFDTIADDFELSLWGQSSTMQSTINEKKKTTYFYPEDEIRDSGFNIIISYGPMNEVDGMKSAESAHSLIGVQLTGVSQIIGGNGQPVEEQYTFIAKDMDGNVAVRA